MSAKTVSLNKRQVAYQQIFIGTLIYAVVLGLFNDYTDVVWAKSFSTILLAGFVLEVLTYLTFSFKRVAVAWHKNSFLRAHKAAKIFIIWLIMFLSKFVFIWVLDVVFGSYLAVDGFMGILLVAASATIAQQMGYLVFRKLAD